MFSQYTTRLFIVLTCFSLKVFGQAFLTACSSVIVTNSACASSTPGFTSLAFRTRASCLCYSSSTYAPSNFDTPWSACLAGYQTADPDLYSSLVSALGTAPCSVVGNVASATGGQSTTGGSSTLGGFSTLGGLSTARPSSLTSSATLDASAALTSACSAFLSYDDYCSSNDPNYASGTTFRQLASCICYTSSTYAPSSFDNAFSTCYRYISASVPSIWSSVTTAGSTFNFRPCAAAGNILTQTTSSVGSGITNSIPSASTRQLSSPTTVAPTVTVTVSSSGAAHARAKVEVAFFAVVVLSALLTQL